MPLLRSIRLYCSLLILSVVIAAAEVPSFKQDIVPILTRYGCNQGGCHGKLAGQNGFRLSLRGYAPEMDYEWITREVKGRRINFAFPEESLLVAKPSGGVLHEGGTRFRKGSRAWQTLVDWIAARAPGPVATEPDAARLAVTPGDQELQPNDRRQLAVQAHWPDGESRDVTWLARFFSNDESVLHVTPQGMVTAKRAGQGSVRVHFQNLVAVVRFAIPWPHEAAEAEYAVRRNAIDGPVLEKLKALRLPPSAECTNAEFLRRASLDATGTLPAPDEAAAFLTNTDPDKRARLVDTLLQKPEWIDYWTLQLADLLQNRKERDHDVRGVKGVRSFHAWLRSQLAAGRGWDAIAREVLMARGDVQQSPATGYFVTVIGERNRVEESELPDSVAQSFLGTRIGCARCHNHPLERYTQDDFYHFAACFAKVSLKRLKPETGATMLEVTTRDEREQRQRCAEAEKRLTEAETAGKPADELAARRRERDEQQKRLTELLARPPAVEQPRTHQQVAARPLDRSALAWSPGKDPREDFVSWMLASPEFAGAMVNRVWKHFFHTGLVEPVDDLRASNPPSNPALWELLSAEFRSHAFDLRHLMRLIMNSRAYQLSSTTRAENETDTQFYSHYYPRRLPAEVLLDAIAAATGVPSEFQGHPLGLRAIQLPEPGVQNYFLTLFGRSDRVTACACERTGAVTLPQLLNLRNGADVQRQIEDANGRLAALLKNPDDRAVVQTLYRSTLSRDPSEAESSVIAQSLGTGERATVFKDLFWALLNAKEFTFNH